MVGIDEGRSRRFSVRSISTRFACRAFRPGHRVRHHAPDVAWPPKGAALELKFAHDKLPNVQVSIHYEIYDGVPVICKWMSIRNNTEETITLDRFTAESLAVVEHANWVEAREGVDLPRPQSIHVETDFAFGGFNHDNANRHVVHWKTDPAFDTQVNYLKQSPCLLQVEPTYGPAQDIVPGGKFESFRTFELFYDSTDRDRRGLSLKRMYRVIAPWVSRKSVDDASSESGLEIGPNGHRSMCRSWFRDVDFVVWQRIQH